jgi:hypothetical protein
MRIRTPIAFPRFRQQKSRQAAVAGIGTLFIVVIALAGCGGGSSSSSSAEGSLDATELRTVLQDELGASMKQQGGTTGEVQCVGGQIAKMTDAEIEKIAQDTGAENGKSAGAAAAVAALYETCLGH